MSAHTDEAIIVWAARKLKVPRDQIESVRFDTEVREGCPTCDFGGGAFHEASVKLKTGKHKYIKDVEFSDVVLEVAETARELR